MAGEADPRVITYRVDAVNRIVDVGAGWSAFARANHGMALLPERVLGSNLLDAISDMTLRELYVRLLQRARAGAPQTFHYRCDAPDRRRTFEMQIRQLPGGTVEFVSTLKHEAPRPSLAVLELERPRDDRMLNICSWCQKVELPDGRWVPVETAVELLHLLEAESFPQLSHGICARCRLEWFPGEA